MCTKITNAKIGYVHNNYYICPTLNKYYSIFYDMTADLKKLVGQRLHLLRMERNLTQEQMSEKLNLSTSAYCKIEYGETDLTLTRLNKIAEVLNMSATELFTKISGDTYNNSQRDYGRVWITRDSSIVNVDNSEDLRELVKSNSRLIDVLVKRIEDLEKSK